MKSVIGVLLMCAALPFIVAAWMIMIVALFFAYTGGLLINQGALYCNSHRAKMIEKKLTRLFIE